MLRKKHYETVQTKYVITKLSDMENLLGMERNYSASEPYFSTAKFVKNLITAVWARHVIS